jgi:cytochrome b subunit of formate dehydrogenase
MIPFILIFGLFTFALSGLPGPLFLLLETIMVFFIAILMFIFLVDKWQEWRKTPYIPSKPRNWG